MGRGVGAIGLDVGGLGWGWVVNRHRGGVWGHGPVDLVAGRPSRPRGVMTLLELGGDFVGGHVRGRGDKVVHFLIIYIYIYISEIK